MEKKPMFFIAITGLVVSIISLFLPVITFVTRKGKTFAYSIFGILTDSEGFEDNILMKYNGPVVWDITGQISIILAAIFLLALILAIVGLFTLRVQRPNTGQFVLTIIGLIGVAIPSLILIICVVGYGHYFEGRLSFGPAPVITIISMIACIFAVIRRKNRVAKELARALEERGMINRPTSL